MIFHDKKWVKYLFVNSIGRRLVDGHPALVKDERCFSRQFYETVTMTSDQETQLKGCKVAIVLRTPILPPYAWEPSMHTQAVQRLQDD